MNRREVIAATALLTTWPALAQTNNAPNEIAPLGAAQPSTAAPAPAEVLGLGDAEKRHVDKTLLVGTLSLDTSKLALQKARNPRVKQFAQFETSEQATVADVLKGVKAAANDMTPAPQLGAEESSVLQKLERSQRDAFDHEYIDGQIAGHQRLLKIQQDYLAVGKNLVNTSVAQMATAVIKEHLTLLRDLEGNG